MAAMTWGANIEAVTGVTVVGNTVVGAGFAFFPTTVCAALSLSVDASSRRIGNTPRYLRTYKSETNLMPW